MTVGQLFDKGLAQVPLTRDEDDSLRRFIFLWTQQAMSECVETENSLRQYRGQEFITQVPLYTKEEQEIPFQNELCENVLPYYIAAYVSKDDEKINEWVYFLQQAKANCDYYKANTYDVIQDVYKGGDWFA